MQQFALIDAKIKLSEIARLVKQTGEPVTFTKGGQPYVDLVPHQQDRPRRPKAEVFAELDLLRKSLPRMTQSEIGEAIAEGRR